MLWSMTMTMTMTRRMMMTMMTMMREEGSAIAHQWYWVPGALALDAFDSSPVQTTTQHELTMNRSTLTWSMTMMTLTMTSWWIFHQLILATMMTSQPDDTFNDTSLDLFVLCGALWWRWGWRTASWCPWCPWSKPTSDGAVRRPGKDRMMTSQSRRYVQRYVARLVRPVGALRVQFLIEDRTSRRWSRCSSDRWSKFQSSQVPQDI